MWDTEGHGLTELFSVTAPRHSGERLINNLEIGLVLHFKKSAQMGWREAQRLGALTALPEFNSQQPHGGSQPSIMGSAALFCV